MNVNAQCAGDDGGEGLSSDDRYAYFYYYHCAKAERENVYPGSSSSEGHRLLLYKKRTLKYANEVNDKERDRESI